MKSAVCLGLLLSFGLSLGCKDKKKSTPPVTPPKTTEGTATEKETGTGSDPSGVGSDATPGGTTDPNGTGAPADQAAIDAALASWKTEILLKEWRICRYTDTKSSLVKLSFKESEGRLTYTRKEQQFSTNDCVNKAVAAESQSMGNLIVLGPGAPATSWKIKIVYRDGIEKTVYQLMHLRAGELFLCPGDPATEAAVCAEGDQEAHVASPAAFKKFKVNSI